MAGTTSGLGPMDEFPIHQIAQPISRPQTSDRNFYDRSYFNAHNRSGEIFVITGIGYYPNLGTKDAFVLINRGGRTHTAVHLSDAIDGDRLHPRVGPYRADVTDPLESIHIRMEPTEGIELDLRFDGLFAPILELPHVMRTGNRTTLDAQRFAQVGSWSGYIVIDDETIPVSPQTWMGSRDRSWGIRPVGEPEPAGRPADPPFEGMWWNYISMAFDDFALVVIVQESPDGFRTLNDCSRVFSDGRIEQLGWPQIHIDYRSGTRIPTGAHLTTVSATGSPLSVDISSHVAAALHVGGGYGGDPDWSHGQWRGPGFTQRLDYDLTDPGIAGRIPFGVIDHVGSAVCHEADGTTHTGWGLFEHGALGRHDPSGFADWLSVAP